MTNQSDYSINYVTSSNDTDKTVVTAEHSAVFGCRENFGISTDFSLDDEIAGRHFATEGSVINELSSMD